MCNDSLNFFFSKVWAVWQKVSVTLKALNVNNLQLFFAISISKLGFFALDKANFKKRISSPHFRLQIIKTTGSLIDSEFGPCFVRFYNKCPVS